MFKKHKGHLRCQISIYSNVNLYKKGTFHHKKGTSKNFRRERAGFVPPGSYAPATNVSDNLMKMSLNPRTLNIGYFCPQSVNVVNVVFV